MSQDFFLRLDVKEVRLICGVPGCGRFIAHGSPERLAALAEEQQRAGFLRVFQCPDHPEADFIPDWSASNARIRTVKRERKQT